MRHGVGFAAQIHDRVRDAAGDVDEGEVAKLAIRSIQARGELRREFEHQSRTLARELSEARIRHFGEFALLPGPHPGAARRLLVEQTHLAEELALVEIGEDHLVAFLVLDHHLNRTAHDVVQDVGKIARVNDDGL